MRCADANPRIERTRTGRKTENTKCRCPGTGRGAALLRVCALFPEREPQEELTGTETGKEETVAWRATWLFMRKSKRLQTVVFARLDLHSVAGTPLTTVSYTQEHGEHRRYREELGSKGRPCVASSGLEDPGLKTADSLKTDL